MEQWLSSIKYFTRYFYNKFNDVELQGILYYLLKRIHNRNVMELGVPHMLMNTSQGYGFSDCE